MIWYAITIFWSAFLLFLVQPILGKQILPWFGGTPAVWTTCLLFFQILLLGGYAYAHGLSAWLAPRAQAIVHSALLAGSLWFLPIVADPAYRSAAETSPTVQILALLTFTIGAPYFLISATGPLLQAWFARTHAKSPYRLYALSNVGSLLALLSYPFLVEPNMHLGAQARSWSWGYVVFAAACALCGAQLFLRGREMAPAPSDDSAAAANQIGSTVESSPAWSTMALWLGLSASASGMLMATTNQICQEVAVVPFLWILPLTLYLLSFIICFDSPQWYDRRVFITLLIASVAAATAMLFVGVTAPLLLQIGTYSITLFACAMACHGELVRARPTASHLTLFYLCVASGGALGGVFVALVAPAIFAGFWEYHLALVVCPLLVVAAVTRDVGGLWRRGLPTNRAAFLLLAFVGLIVALLIQIGEYRKQAVMASRNFYGVLRVRDAFDETLQSPLRKLLHGGILHGIQLLEGDMRRWPVSYYSPGSGIWRVMTLHPRRAATAPADRSLRVGVIGLGAGTLAALAQEGDTIRFYDINPDVIEIAKDYFYYLEDTAAQWSIAEGDARLLLENELAADGPQQFDVLVMDAFSSDAIPMHLVTRECVEMYWKHLKPDGILVVNISNRNVDMKPVIRAMAEANGKEALYCDSAEDASTASYGATWAMMTSNQEFLQAQGESGVMLPIAENVKPVVWTDDYGSLWQVLRRFSFYEWRSWLERWLPWLKSNA